MSGDTEGRTQTNEIEFLFSLTGTFSESFTIKRDRVRNWRLMGILMELENGGSVAARPLRKAIAPLVLKRRSTDSLYSWLDTFVEKFENAAGGFLDRVTTSNLKPTGDPKKATKNRKTERARAPNTVSFQLNKNFFECANKYVRQLLETHKDEFNLPATITNEQAHRVMKAIFKFQTAEYWPFWVVLLNNLSSTAAAKKYATGSIDSDTFNLLHWVVLLLFYRLSLDAPNDWWDIIDINGHAKDVLLLADPDELTEVVDFFARDTGGKILLTRKRNAEAVYSLNGDYSENIREYISAAASVRPKLPAQIAAALNEHSE